MLTDREEAILHLGPLWTVAGWDVACPTDSLCWVNDLGAFWWDAELGQLWEWSMSPGAWVPLRESDDWREPLRVLLSGWAQPWQRPASQWSRQDALTTARWLEAMP